MTFIKIMKKRRSKMLPLTGGILVNDLHRRLKRGKFQADLMDFVYIDEVQDLTMRQIALYKYICRNVDEGFVFSGDTAQTIARGIHFRFQEIRTLFFNEFLAGSSQGKGQLSETLHLTQNFRTHDGILKLAQSVIDLIYRICPASVDALSLETSLINGDAPVLLEPQNDENAIITLFGDSRSTRSITGFSAEQVILVRDELGKKEIADRVGNKALIHTIEECKGLEFQLLEEGNYEMATMCFERAGDTYGIKFAKASGLRAGGGGIVFSNPEAARAARKEAADMFASIGKSDMAASCLYELEEYKRAATLYPKHQKGKNGKGAKRVKSCMYIL